MAGNARWHFQPFRPGDKERQSVVEAFFANTNLGDLPEGIVREAIQNSLDAAADENSPVSVRFRFSSVPASHVDPFWEGLQEHLAAVGLELPHRDHVKTLIIEDFNTRGLEGNTDLAGTNPDTSNDYYHFFFAEGKTEKTKGKNRGTWGIGKYVFHLASETRAVFALTTRRSTRDSLMMGVIVLRTHQCRNRKYHPDGWYGIRPSEDDFVHPVTDQHPRYQEFVNTFSIDRGGRPGLSVVIPGISRHHYVAPHLITIAVLKHWYWAILQNHLEVIIVDEHANTCLVNYLTIQKFEKNLADEILTLAAENGGEIEETKVEVEKLATVLKGACKMRQLRSPNIDLSFDRVPATVDQLKEAFPEEQRREVALRLANGEAVRVRFTFPLRVRDRSRQAVAEPASVDIMLDPVPPEKATGVPQYLREDLLIPRVRTNRLPELSNFNAYVVVHAGRLAELLALAEGPAHLDWKQRPDEMKERFVAYGQTIAFVENAPRWLVRVLRSDETVLDTTFLARYFPRSGPPHPPPSREETPFRITPLENGFSIALNRQARGSASRIGSVVRVRCAYDVRRGNPFSAYSPADFDLTRMQVEEQAATVLEVNPNELRVRIEGEDFRLRVRGFDPNRAIVVDVTVEQHEGTNETAPGTDR